MTPLPRHLTAIRALGRDGVERILDVAGEMEGVLAKGGDRRLEGKILASLFFEPSTRTRLSTEAAMRRLGGSVISVSGAEGTSLTKGESLEDTIRMAASYADIICMRHPQEGAADRAAAASSVPFVNGGDGGNEHPTQSLLDAYTVRKELGRLDNLHVAFSCDPKHSRTIRSLALILSLYPGNRFTFISPDSLRAAPELLKDLRASGVECAESADLRDGLDADILYMNRLQKERLGGGEDAAALTKAYRLTADLLKGKKVLVMDPLPRIDEIAPDVDALQNAAYFREAANGIPVRMAILALLLGAA
jgi:aspartate carbamoyltransferase catalytic subunit